ncbi:MAG: hypothetical protein HC859_09415, partial [Bacteroidia bacterium]|nr:hypothetical protein [Bacteroidia bacterium]
MVYLLAHDPEVDSTEYDRLKNQLTSYASELQKATPRFKTESRFLRYLFYKVHRTFLKQYRLSEPFNGLFNSGSYNCVSGTALYAFFLDQLGYAVRICETRYHIFLLTYLSDSTSVLFEATDPLDGFVENQALIEQRIT